jgi:hypothetical protein
VSEAAARSAEATARLLDWLGEVGPRWGIPAEACRAHGVLYLGGRGATPEEIARGAGLDPAELERALAWLQEHRLAAVDAAGRWSTGSDPWEIVMAALAVRREHEMGPARAVLDRSYADAAGDPALAVRIRRLRDLVDDVAAIDAQAQRLSPAMLRRLLGAGGTAARLFGRAFGSGGGGQRR